MSNVAVFAAVWLCALTTSYAAILDRIAVAVGNQVITESALNLNVRLTEFMNDQPLDVSPDSRRAAARRLIEQKLVMKELEFSRYPRPSMADMEPRMKNFIERRFHGDHAAFQAALAKYGLTENDFKQYLFWQITFLRFVDYRFRPGIQVSDQDVEEYFKTNILPLAQAAHPNQPVSLDDYRDRIERVLTGQRVDQELNAWLKEARARTKIEYHQEAFQ